jgi:hypothetical protein
MNDGNLETLYLTQPPHELEQQHRVCAARNGHANAFAGAKQSAAADFPRPASEKVGLGGHDHKLPSNTHSNTRIAEPTQHRAAAVEFGFKAG